MKAGQLVAYIAAAILLLFGVLFVLATFSSQGQIGWLVVGVILIAAGLGLIWLVYRRGREDTLEVIQKVEISGEVDLEKMQCKNCGGTLSSEHVTMVAGAPVVECPYCNTSYHLEEEPKW
jgi:Na+/melibiose symporter-like transporter